MGKYKNRVSLIGVVGKDAMTYKTQGGVTYARFSLATAEGGYKRADGMDVPEVTQWHNIIAWRGLGEFVGQYVKKGMKVAVDGKIIYGEYEKQGVKCMAVDITAEDVFLMSKGTNTSVDEQKPVAADANGQKPNPVQRDIFSTDLPF